MKYVIHFIIFVLILCITGNAFPQSLNNTKTDGYRGIWFELNQKYPYGDKYAGGLGTYTADHFPLAVYAEEVGKTFFVYGGTTDRDQRHLLCMIGCYDHQRNLLEKPTVVYDKTEVDDPHDNPSLLIDTDGYIWVFVAGRSTRRNGFKYRSTKPYSIDEFEQVTEEVMCYPQPWQMDDGMIHLFTKYTGIRELYFETSKDGYDWSEDKKLAGIREPGDAKGGHYQVSQKNGKVLGTFFNRHPNGNVDKRTDIYYLQTVNMGQTWTNAAGQTVEVPLTEVENPARVMNYRDKGLNAYICDMGFDQEEHPVCLYLTSRGHQPGPDNAPYMWHMTRWDGNKWITSEIGTSDHDYDMGSLYILPDKWLVVAPLVNGPQLWGAGGELAFYESTDQGNRWVKTKQLTCNSQRNHGYVRRPQNACDPFFYFWADGDPLRFSISHLYFGNSKGNVWQMPYHFTEETAIPVPYSQVKDQQ